MDGIIDLWGGFKVFHVLLNGCAVKLEGGKTCQVYGEFDVSIRSAKS